MILIFRIVLNHFLILILFCGSSATLIAQQHPELKEYFQQTSIKNHEVKQLDVLDSDIENNKVNQKKYLRSKITYKFNRKGKIIEKLSFSPDEIMKDSLVATRKVIFKYNRHGEVSRITDTNFNLDQNKFHTRIRYRYKKGKVAEKRYINANGAGHRIQYKYNENQLLIKEITIISDSIENEIFYYYSGPRLDSIFYKHTKATETHKFSYDSLGNKTTVKFNYEGNLICGNLPTREEFEYYSDGKMKSRISYEFGPILKEEYIYENNLLKTKYTFSGPALSQLYKLETIRYQYTEADLPKLIIRTDENGSTTSQTEFLYH